VEPDTRHVFADRLHVELGGSQKQTWMSIAVDSIYLLVHRVSSKLESRSGVAGMRSSEG
jgi:hypothetical protein